MILILSFASFLVLFLLIGDGDGIAGAPEEPSPDGSIVTKQTPVHFLWNRMDALCAAVILWCLTGYVLAEILSVGRNLTETGLRIGWSAATAAAGFVTVQLCFGKQKKGRLSGKALKQGECLRERFLLIPYVLYGVWMLRSALGMPLYHWDSMTYHLTRILMWEQNRSIAHFATTVKRAVSSPVLMEVLNLQVDLLGSGTDSRLNLLQCVSYLLSIILVYAIARMIGIGARGALFATILFLCAPIAVAESMTTQNDLFCTVFLLVFVYEAARILNDPAMTAGGSSTGRLYSSLRLLILAGAAGLGYLAKPSIMIGIVVFAAALVIRCFRNGETGKSILLWTVCAPGIAFLIIAPEIARNLVTYGAISDPWQGKGQLIHTPDPRLWLVSFLKNLFFNLPSVWWKDASGLMDKIVYFTAYHLGVNADDPAISEFGLAYRLTEPPDYGCDSAISPVPVAAMLTIPVLFLVRKIYAALTGSGAGTVTGTERKTIPSGGQPDFAGKSQSGQAKAARIYTACAFLSIILILTFARWEIWVGRYFAAYLAVVCPAVVLCFRSFGKAVKDGRLYTGFLAGIFVFMSVVELCGAQNANNTLRKELSAKDRSEAYYCYNAAGYEREYLPLSQWDGWDAVKSVGLCTDEDSYVYPMLRFLQDKGIHTEFVNATGGTERYEDVSYQPDVVIYIGSGRDAAEELTCHGRTYGLVLAQGAGCAIYEAKTPAQ